MSESLPIDAHIDRILDQVRRMRAAVVTAAPGAGKTTRVPVALAKDGPVLLLQPRRVAARAIAHRIAAEQGWTLGREVGWHVRFDRRSSVETRLLVATEGILTARLQQDPLLSDFHTIVIDEFHERSIHADLGLALARQAWLARSDLRLVIMSATLDAAPVSAYLGGCPVIEVPGRTFPLEILYRPQSSIDSAVSDALTRTRGAILCFLAGAAEIRRATVAVAAVAQSSGVPVLPLHGSLDAGEQDAAVQGSTTRRIILATNIAETTVTVPGVTCVVDTGLHKVARYDPARAIDSLEIERIAQDSADQRAGRAGRTQAGLALRLWDARDRLRPHREPEIARVDLAGPVLDILAWGGDPRTFEWFESPRPESLTAALDLLHRLNGIDHSGRLTELGRQLRRLPLHPRLGRIIIDAKGAPEAARACALLSERHFVPPRSGATSCDLLAAIDREQNLPAHVTRAARDIRESARSLFGSTLADRIDDAAFRRAVLAGYPDRVAHRRAPNSDRLVLSSGTGARLARESGVLNAEFLIAVDVTAGVAGPAHEALVRLATGIDETWLTPTSRAIEHQLDSASGKVRASRIDRYDRLVLREVPCAPDPEVSAPLVADAYIRRGPTAGDQQLLRRLGFAGVAASFDELVRSASSGATALDEIDLAERLAPQLRHAIARDAPLAVRVPSGRDVRVEYRDGEVFAAVKLQELFGLADTPRLGPNKVPVTFELLAPNGRPVQITKDLKSFWARGYPEVRRELRARYPKHPWPEDPWTATPTGRALRRR